MQRSDSPAPRLTGRGAGLPGAEMGAAGDTTMKTVKITKAQTLARRIDEHGRALLRAFPNCTERDPARLCKRLRQLEIKAGALALAHCNGTIETENIDTEGARLLGKADALLGFVASGVPVFFNHDPRGYALKIDEEWMREHGTGIHRDWGGGYGIIAPDLREGA